MSESRTIIRVFLASPGDLADERQAAKEAVDEVNATTAKPRGYQIDLYGWEDTISAAGRPQAIINEELKQCELFIGMLWTRWGTPPDNDGHHTSGFEEEFELASQMRAVGGSPELRMYFKTVDADRIKDPGQELSKVLTFRNKLITEKAILFENFADTAEYSRKLRLGLADYVNRKQQRDAAIDQNSEVAEGVSAPESNVSQSDIQPQEVESDRAAFLETFARKLRGSDQHTSIPAFEIARLRLAAAAPSWQGNDEPELGPHDANLVYRNRRELRFEPLEIRRLAEFGLGALQTQNKPLWSWLASAVVKDVDWLATTTWSERGPIRKGAFEAAKLGHFPILDNAIIDRRETVKYLLDREDDEAQKDALEHLKSFGNEEDCQEIMERLETAPSSTSRNYLEAALGIKLRYDPTDAAQLVVRSRFDTLDDSILLETLGNFSCLTADQLLLALEHRNPEVRRTSLAELAKRKLATADIGRRFADDANLGVRQAALSIIERFEPELSMPDISKVLIKHNRQQSASVLSGGGFDLDGYRAFEKVKSERLARRPPAQLEAMIAADDIDSEFAYFALAAKEFEKRAAELRSNFDDRFVSYYANELELTERSLGASPSAKSAIEKRREINGFKRKEYLRTALDIFIARPSAEDLTRIRGAIDEGAVDIGFNDFAYLTKFGDWSDIERLTKMSEKYDGSRRGILGLGQSLMPKAANVIYTIGRKNFQELVSLSMQHNLKAKILAQATQTEIRSLSDGALGQLLLAENDGLRKVAALMSVISLGPRRVRKLLTAHLAGERYYYNVIHWLDLVVAFPYEKAKAIARRALDK
jgi:hypothetical protein